MNIQTQQRPSRAPAPPPETTYADATFTEIERPNNLPARSNGAQRAPQVTPDQLVVAPSTSAKVYPAKIAKALIAITRQIAPVEKAGFNDFHKYHYAKWEDVLENLAPLIAEHGLIIQQGEVAHGGFERDLIEIGYEFTIVNEDGEVWPDKPLITAICKVRDAKGVLDDKAASKCHTQAAKYMMTSLFKIRVQDMADADSSGDGSQRQRPQGQVRRPVPSPEGKLPPHFLPIVDQELPQSWATRFGAFIAKATSQAEIDKWYEANVAVFDRLKEKHTQVYNDALDFMDACAAKLAGGKSETKTDPISSGKPATTATASGFPGDTKMIAQDDGSIPWQLDRKLSDSDRDWLISLKEAFEQCRQVEEIASEQESMMLPSQDTVTPYVWQKAVDLVAKNIERING